MLMSRFYSAVGVRVALFRTGYVGRRSRLRTLGADGLYRGGVNATTARLILLLRVAYIIGLSLFVIDVLLAIALQTMLWILTDETPDELPLSGLMDWIAVVAFVFIVIGSVLTIVTTSEFARAGVDVDADKAH